MAFRRLCGKRTVTLRYAYIFFGQIISAPTATGRYVVLPERHVCRSLHVNQTICKLVKYIFFVLFHKLFTALFIVLLTNMKINAKNSEKTLDI